jgi:hypothetical protein
MLRQRTVSIAQIAKEIGLPRQAACRVKDAPAAAEAALAAWRCDLYRVPRAEDQHGASSSGKGHAPNENMVSCQVLHLRAEPHTIGRPGGVRGV